MNIIDFINAVTNKIDDGIEYVDDVAFSLLDKLVDSIDSLVPFSYRIFARICCVGLLTIFLGLGVPIGVLGWILFFVAFGITYVKRFATKRNDRLNRAIRVFTLVKNLPVIIAMIYFRLNAEGILIYTLANFFFAGYLYCVSSGDDDKRQRRRNRLTDKAKEWMQQEFGNRSPIPEAV